ncbi:alpha/beta fold hydrolase [Roseinatronobacter sp.]|uniref:alpha/beta fold hydrolase n=1 Tax=Roseinatronobacter sp. TaxID=1945755 RepID=UPI0025FA1D3B|nr:alpha/beta hydrolase [Rhodobaca sp.]
MHDPAPFFAEISDAPPPKQVIWQQAQDGTRLRVALWPVGPKGIVAIFPGRTEVIEKYGRVIADLAKAGYGAAAIDWRGQGLSDRLQAAPLLGDVADFSLYQQDVAVYQAALDDHARTAPRFVLAHSMGGCIALRALINGFPARAVSFSAPMWGLPLTGTTRRAIKLLRSTLRLTRLDLREIPGAGIEFRLWENPFDNNELTRDAETYGWMQAQVAAKPELRLGAPSLRWVAAALSELADLHQIPSPDIPAFCGLGTREMLVSASAIEARMAAWPKGRLEIYDGALHELLMEQPVTRNAFLESTLSLFDAYQP